MGNAGAGADPQMEEELAIRNARGLEITRYQFAYPGKSPIVLIFHRVTEFEGEPQNLIYREMRWEPRAKLSTFDFIEGDRLPAHILRSRLIAP